ncbi:unnamed protein product, partial [Meganyctiphanes norvegica]
MDTQEEAMESHKSLDDEGSSEVVTRAMSKIAIVDKVDPLAIKTKERVIENSELGDFLANYEQQDSEAVHESVAPVMNGICSDTPEEQDDDSNDSDAKLIVDVVNALNERKNMSMHNVTTSDQDPQSILNLIKDEQAEHNDMSCTNDSSSSKEICVDNFVINSEVSYSLSSLIEVSSSEDKCSIENATHKFENALCNGDISIIETTEPVIELGPKVPAGLSIPTAEDINNLIGAVALDNLAVLDTEANNDAWSFMDPVNGLKETELESNSDILDSLISCEDLALASMALESSSTASPMTQERGSSPDSDSNMTTASEGSSIPSLPSSQDSTRGSTDNTKENAQSNSDTKDILCSRKSNDESNTLQTETESDITVSRTESLNAESASLATTENDSSDPNSLENIVDDLLTITGDMSECQNQELLENQTSGVGNGSVKKICHTACHPGIGKESLSALTDDKDCTCKSVFGNINQQDQSIVGIMKLWYNILKKNRSIIPHTNVTAVSISRARPSINRIKALANMLVSHDPHQLYLRLSQLAHELCVELKVRLLATIHDNPTPQETAKFVQGVCDSYQWVMNVCEALHPAMERLDGEHLSRFKLNWVTVNMHIFHSTILTDPDVLDYLICCKEKVAGSEGGEDILGCLGSLERTLGMAEAVWLRSDALLQDYAVERAALAHRRRQLLADWEQFKAQQHRSQQQQQEHSLKTLTNSSVAPPSVTGTGEESVGCPCDDCSGSAAAGASSVTGSVGESAGGVVSSQTSQAVVASNSSSIAASVTSSTPADTCAPATCECHFCNASSPATGTKEHMLGVNNNSNVSSSSGLPPLAQPQLSLYPHIHSTPPGSDIVSVGGQVAHRSPGDDLGHALPPPPPTTKPPLTTNPYLGSDLLTEQLMREWELVYGDTLTPPGSHPILPPPDGAHTLCSDPSSLVSSVEGLSLNSAVSRPPYAAALPYVPDSTTTATTATTVPRTRTQVCGGVGNSLVSSTMSLPVGQHSHGGVGGNQQQGYPPSASNIANNSCSSGGNINTTSVITHTRQHHHHPAQVKGDLNAPSSCCGGHAPPHPKACGESGSSGCEDGDEWSSGDESDSSTTVSSSHQDPHCDCCYCHMLHHKQGGGRQKYSDRRDRLLQILNRKKKAQQRSSSSSTNNTTITPPTIDTTISTTATTNIAPTTPEISDTIEVSTTAAVSPEALGGQNIDQILDFIEGNQDSKPKNAKKQAKKARQKQKKLAIRREEEFDEYDDDDDDDDDDDEDDEDDDLGRYDPNLKKRIEEEEEEE